jgi:hypothetical protein
MAERIARMKEKAAANGRELRFGVRFHVLSRDTHEEAIAAAEQQMAGVTAEQVARVQSVLTATDSAGESRQRAFVAREDLWVEPNLWAGVGQVRRGIGVTVIGSHEEVARKFLAFHDMGSRSSFWATPPGRGRERGLTWMPRSELLRRAKRAGGGVTSGDETLRSGNPCRRARLADGALGWRRLDWQTPPLKTRRHPGFRPDDEQQFDAALQALNFPYMVNKSTSR